MVTTRAYARCVRSGTAAAAATGPPRGGASGPDGADACRAVPADTELASIQVVILSEQDRLAGRSAAHAARADASLAKPYSPLALLDVVQRLFPG